MTVKFVNTQQEPLPDAVVTVAEAPGQTQDIGYLTDENGAISVDVPEAGAYTFTVSHHGQVYRASVNIAEQDSTVTLVVE